MATPLKLMSSIITGSERPFAFTANRINRYDVVASRLSNTKDTGGLCEYVNKKNWLNICKLISWTWSLKHMCWTIKQKMEKRMWHLYSQKVSNFGLILMLVFRPFPIKTFVVIHHQRIQCTQRELSLSIDLTLYNFAMQTDVLQINTNKRGEIRDTQNLFCF